MKLFIFALIFFSCSIAFSQEDPHPVIMSGRTIAPTTPKSYADSEEFTKLFKEFYPSIKPSKSVKEQADQYFQSMSRSFAMQGIDSAEAAKAAFKNLDSKAFEKIYFDIYRRNLSAKELKKYIAFMETPEGKHIAEVWSNLQRGTSEATMYVARTLNLNLTPIRQAAREKMEKEHPNQQPGMLSPGMVSPGMIARPSTPGVFDQGNAASRDSLIRTQQSQKKIPPVKIPPDPSK